MIRKNITFAIVVLFLNLLISCWEKEKVYVISKIEIASDGGERSLNGHVLALDSSLDCSFYGGRDFKKPGFFKGQISNELWMLVNEKLEHADYKAVLNSNGVSMPDAEHLEIIIYNGSNKKHFTICNCGKKTPLLQTVKWILGNYDKVPLEMTKDSIKFNTTYQNPPNIPQEK